MTIDNRNDVQTKLQSSLSAGIVGTNSAHPLLIRTDNNTIAQFDVAGGMRLNNYGNSTFTGTPENILAVNDNGFVIEIDPLSLNTDDQTVDEFLINGSNVLSLSLEDDGAGPLTVNLAPYLDNTDDQQITAFDYDDVSNDITITLEDGGTRMLNLDALDNAGTDDQALSLTGNTLTLEDGGTVNLTPYLDNTDDQTLTYTNADPDDNVNTLQIEGGSAFDIDDNHLGTDDQTLTEARNINLSGFGLNVNSLEGTTTFTNTGNLLLNDESSPLVQVQDNTNSVQTKLQSSNSAGIIGTTSAHPLQIRTDNTSIAQFETSGQLRLNSYGSGTFSGAVTNLLGVSSNGTVREVDAASLNTYEQDLTLSGNILSLTNDPTTVDLAPYLDNTDDQTIDLFNINSADILSLSLESDGQAAQTVDLSPYRDGDVDWFEVGATQADDISDNIFTVGNVGINENNPQYALHVDGGDPSTGGPWAVIEGGSNIRDNIALRLYDEGNAANSHNILEFAHRVGSDANTSSHIKSKSEGTASARGADLILETASDDQGTLNTDQLVLNNDGNVGIGTGTPDARLDVEGGQVRFSDYGDNDTYTDTPGANYLLGVDANGDVVQSNTARSARIFYPPAIVIDVSTISTGESIDLWQEYQNRFGSPLLSSPSAAGAIPTYSREELEYYITDLDNAVFDNLSLDDNGVLTYDVVSVPPGNCTFINVVFVVK
jgi:hypothetical protein